MFEFGKLYAAFKENVSLKDIIFVGIMLALYAVTRLVNLENLPIFSDEGIYIHWAKIAWHDASLRFISLTDGKQPFQTWGTIPFLKLFPDNALLAGRLFAVTTGLYALTGVFTLLMYLWGKKAAYLGAFFYIFTPLFLFYDRIALVDSGVNGSFIWILFFSILLARTRRLDVSLVLGLISGMALLMKSSVRIFVGLAGLGFILFFEKNARKFLQKLISFFVLYGISAAIALIIYNIQRLSPFFHYVAEKNKTFVMTFEELIQNPFALFFTNITLVPTYVLWEMGFVLGIFGLVGLFLLYKKDKKLFYYFLLWIVIPYIIVSFLSKVLFPRYIIFFGSLLLILATYFFIQLKTKSLIIISCMLYALSVGYFDTTIMFYAKSIPFPQVDRGQYIEGWPAGWGMKEIMEFAREKSKEKPVIILAEGNFGLAGDVLDTYLKPGDAISIRGHWPLGEKELRESQKELQQSYVYAVFAHEKNYPAHWPLKLIKKFDKPGNNATTHLFELTN